VTRPAEADIDDAYIWLYEHSPAIADRLIRGVWRAIFSLKEFPARCPVAPEGREMGREILEPEDFDHGFA